MQTEARQVAAVSQIIPIGSETNPDADSDDDHRYCDDRQINGKPRRER
jgi:hypothetical protein